MKRICKKCGVEKDIDTFVKSNRCNYGYTHTCKDCQNKMNRTDKRRGYDKIRYKNSFTVCTQCENCKIFFMASNRKKKEARKYCSLYCAGIAKKGIPRPKQVMDVMKKTWIKKGQRLSPKTEFKKGHISKVSFKKGHIPWNDSFTFVECAQCGKTLKRKPTQTRRHKNHYCSRQCIKQGFYTGKWNIAKLGDYYVRSLILASTPWLKKEDVTPEMIEIKRELLTARRLIEEIDHVINSN